MSLAGFNNPLGVPEEPQGPGEIDTSVGESMFETMGKPPSFAPTAEEMAKIFLEIVIAPFYTDEALEVFKAKKNLRVLRLPTIQAKLKESYMDMKKVAGGLLIQQMNRSLIEGELKTATKREPTKEEMEDLLFAWKVVKHVKSNAITLARGTMMVFARG